MRVARIAGIVFKIHPLTLLMGIIYAGLGLAVEILLIITAVLLHEIAHNVMAVIMGVKVAEVELLPFGGQAIINDFTGLEPEKEIYIALVGPLLSLSLAALLYFLQINPDNAYIPFFIKINFLLGCFNLLPALPLDGGRVVRAVLSLLSGYRKATYYSALAGQLIAVLLTGYGTYLICAGVDGANLIVIGLLLFRAAYREGRLLAYSFMRFLLHKKSQISRQGFLDCREIVSKPDTTVKSILNNIRPNYYTMVVILDEQHRVIGVLSEAELIECLLEKGPLATIKDCRL